VSELADHPAAEHATEQRLQQTIDLIDEDVALIELWALALSSFARPAARYDFGDEPDPDGARR
jgi:hypothetical protein